MIRIFLVDDQSLVRAGLKLVIDSQRDMAVVGEAGDGAAAVALASRELGIKPEHARRGWEYFTRTQTITPDLSVNKPGLVKVIEVLKAAGQVPSDISADPDRYINPSYLATAAQR